jgi:hypothetical protein
MKTKKLLRKMKALLSADRRAQIAEYDSLEKVLKKLQEKESALREKLDREKDEERRHEIRRKLEVMKAQRKKGASLMKKIKGLRDSE